MTGLNRDSDHARPPSARWLRSAAVATNAEKHARQKAHRDRLAEARREMESKARRKRLLSRRFLGEIELLEIAVNGAEGPLRARVRERVYTSPGGAVGVNIDPSEVLVFAGVEA